MPAEATITIDAQAVSWISERSPAFSSAPVGPRRASATYDSRAAPTKIAIATRGARVPGAGEMRPPSQAATYHSRTTIAQTVAGVPADPRPGTTIVDGTSSRRTT